MQVAVIGGGSIGLLYSYYFAESGMSVCIYVKRQDQADALNELGLHLLHESGFSKVNVPSHVFGDTKSVDADLVVVAVKQYHLPDLMSSLSKKISNESKLLFLQNGMSHVHLLETFPHPNILVGIVEHGALKLGDHQVQHTGVGKTKLAAFRGNLYPNDPLWDMLARTELAFHFQDDWYKMMAEKLLVNAVINPLTALYRVANGELIARDGFMKNMRRLFDEAFETLHLENEAYHWKNVLKVCEMTAKNRSSMLRDIEQGRQTEIEAISGYLLTEAKRTKMSLPFTQFVYDSVQGLALDQS